MVGRKFREVRIRPPTRRGFHSHRKYGEPGCNWSAWAGPYSQTGQKVEAPAARFAQWKAVLRSGSPSPVLSWMSLSYLPKNVAPQIDGIAVQDPGIRIQNRAFPEISAAGNQPSRHACGSPKLPGHIAQHKFWVQFRRTAGSHVFTL